MRITNTCLFFVAANLASLSYGQSAISPEALAGWERFKSSVLANFKDAVVVQAKFPIPANDLGGAVKSDKQLRQRFDDIFAPWVKDCFKEAQPEPMDKKDGFVVNCNGYLFGFTKVNADYKFSYIDNVKE